MDISKIKEHLTVHAKGESNIIGASIGTVEHMDGEKYIKLTKSDSPDGLAHWIPINWVEYVDDRAVYLNKTHNEIMTELMVYQCRPSIK